MTDTCIDTPYSAKTSPYSEKDSVFAAKDTPFSTPSYCPILLQEDDKPILQENKGTILL